MSEISVLSNQYDQLVATSEKVNNSVITFKKKSILNTLGSQERYPKLSVTSEELKRAKDILLDFLDNIKKLVAEDFKGSDYIPSVILDDYKRKLSLNPYLKEDLAQLSNLLKQNQPIDGNHLQILDNILSILDNERSTLFRKLRTARG